MTINSLKPESSLNPGQDNKSNNSDIVSIDDLINQLYTNQPEDITVKIDPLSLPDSTLESETIEGDLIIDSDKQEKREESVDVDQKNVIPSFDQQTTDIIRSIIVSGLYLSGNQGLNIYEIKRILSQWSVNSKYVQMMVKDINHHWTKVNDIGLMIDKYGEYYKIVTRSHLKPYLSNIIKIHYHSALTPSLLEVLGIIAYNNPCTKQTIYNIRKIDPTNSIDKLIRLQLVYRSKRSNDPGRPYLYKLTNKFFDVFGIKSTNQLPKVNVQTQLDLNPDNTDIHQDDFFNTNRPDIVDSSVD